MVHSDIYHHTGCFKKLPSSPKPKPNPLPQLAELQPYFVFNPPPPPPAPLSVPVNSKLQLSQTSNSCHSWLGLASSPSGG